jgi:rare lipoprotein A
MASVYSDGFNRVLADGKHHSVDELLVAHRKLPFGTVLDITLVATGATVRVVVRDRGPFVRNRCIDLSAGAARAIGLASTGRVKIEQVAVSP